MDDEQCAILSYIFIVLRKNTVVRAAAEVGNFIGIRIVQRRIPYGKAVVAELLAPAAQSAGKAQTEYGKDDNCTADGNTESSESRFYDYAFQLEYRGKLRTTAYNKNARPNFYLTYFNTRQNKMQVFQKHS